MKHFAAHQFLESKNTRREGDLRGGESGSPGAGALAHVHRIGVELARCNGDGVRHDVPFSPFPLRGLIPEGQEPRSCSPSSRGAVLRSTRASSNYDTRAHASATTADAGIQCRASR
uniref:Uncharacterized protein n=1 Tax=Rhizobium meliloti TaxID=382 RepID=Q4VP15_RHIML|nr:unknown [Sinorhizobium meliloti]